MKYKIGDQYESLITVEGGRNIGDIICITSEEGHFDVLDRSLIGHKLDLVQFPNSIKLIKTEEAYDGYY